MRLKIILIFRDEEKKVKKIKKKTEKMVNKNEK